VVVEEEREIGGYHDPSCWAAGETLSESPSVMEGERSTIRRMGESLQITLSPMVGSTKTNAGMLC